MARLIPPVNFGMVEENLYRSGLPTELNFPFLERLRLKKIIYLAQDEVDATLSTFVEENAIELVCLGTIGGRIKALNLMVTEETVLAALSHFFARESYPLLICCHLGRTRTGSVIGCLRKIQRWHLSSIFEEFRRYCGKVRLKNEQFIELFDTDLVPVLDDRPGWLGVAAAGDHRTPDEASAAAAAAAVTAAAAAVGGGAGAAGGLGGGGPHSLPAPPPAVSPRTMPFYS